MGKVPFDPEDKTGIVYVWIGSKVDNEDARVAEDIASTLYNPEFFSLQILNMGEEPDYFFWVGLGTKKTYGKEADFMEYTRLFKCSNEKGYFTVSEKCSDFCQDDLADDDIMILDSGVQVFYWMDPRCSEVLRSAIHIYAPTPTARDTTNPATLNLSDKPVVVYKTAAHANFVMFLHVCWIISVLTRLSHLAASWGGKDNGFGLSKCCSDDPIGTFVGGFF